MSKFANGGTRTKSARETYVEQLPYGRGLTPYMNKKRKPFTHINSTDEADYAYRSAPDYLRQLTQQTSTSPTEMMLVKHIPRTKSASELTPRINPNRSMNGNPKYKAQEDYYDEVQSLKKEMKATKEENSNLRAKLRRSEEDNARRRKEIDTLYDTSKDGDLRRTLSGSSTDRNNNNSTANVVMSLKQRVFKLELQLKQKETTIDEIKSDPRWTKSTELEIQNRALAGELERKKVERLNRLHQNDYNATVDEEAKNAIRKLSGEKNELKKENETLKHRIQELDKSERKEQVSARSSDENKDKGLQREIENLRKECTTQENALEQKENEIKRLRREREKFDEAKEEMDGIKRERDQFRQKFEQANKDLERMKREHDAQKKSNQAGRSSPALKSGEEPSGYSNHASSTRYIQPHSPIPTKQTPRASALPIRQNSNSSDEDSKSSKPANKPNSSRTSSINTSYDNSNKKPHEVHSPRSSYKVDAMGSGPIKNPPSSTSTSNEAAIKTTQASLRGYMTRSEMDKSRHETTSPTPKSEKSTKAERSAYDESDANELRKQWKPSASPYESGKKPDPKQSLYNDKTGSNNRLNTSNRDLASDRRESPSPTNDKHRASPPRVGSGGGSKKSLTNEQNKYETSAFKPISDKELASKLNSRQTPSPTKDKSQPSSPRGSSTQASFGDRNKYGSGTRIPTGNRESAAKLNRSGSPPDDTSRPSSAQGGSKQPPSTDQNKHGSGSRTPIGNRESAAKLNRSGSPPIDTSRPSSAQGGSKQPPSTSQNKLGSGNRFQANDRDLSSKLPRASSPLNTSSRKSPTNSKQSVKNSQNDDDDDDNDVI